MWDGPRWPACFLRTLRADGLAGTARWRRRNSTAARTGPAGAISVEQCGGAGADDRLRQSGQPAPGARSSATEGDCGAALDWSGTRAYDPPTPDSEPLAGEFGSGAWLGAGSAAVKICC